MDNDSIWKVTHLTKSSNEPMQHGLPSETQSSEDPPRSESLRANDPVNESISDLDSIKNGQRSGVYALTRSRLMSLPNRNWHSLEVDLERRTDDELSCKYRLKYYIVIIIFIIIITLISIGIKVFIQLRTQHRDQDDDGQFSVCFQSFEQYNASNDPFFFCKCVQSSSKLDDTYWNVYNLVMSTRGISEHVSEDELIQVCSPPNIAIQWIAWEIRSSLNRNEYVDFETIQTRFVLVLLHITWNGSQWKNHTGWLSNRTVCEWHGIGCDSDNAVIKISLRQNKLQGKLDSRLGLLRRLKVLDLVQNDISGSIPVELWSLSMLDIQLGYNSITGTISFDLGLEASSLKSVYLDFNPISGILPNAEGWKNLTNLSISNTAISGTIPNELGLLTYLERISLNRNPTLSGTLPLSLTFLSNLKILDLSFVDLSGTIPESIGNLIYLQYISINSPNIAGLIPTTIGYLSQLVHLDFSSSSLCGRVPSEIGMCTSLEVLRLSHNKLSGSIPCEIQNLVMLKEIEVNDNIQLMGDLSDDILSLPNLNYIDLHGTEIKVNCSKVCIKENISICSCN